MIMGVRAKGASAIKTLAATRNSGVHSNERHVHQFQIATLELERTRRGQEMKAALARIASLEARLAEIDGQIAQHQKALGLTIPPVPVSSASLTSEPQPGSEERRRKFRY
jgi:hypothetical protein